MPSDSRDLVRRALRFESPARIPRQLWVLPWFETRFADATGRLRERFPDDIVGAASPYRPSPRRSGDPYRRGEYVDEWGCRFDNLHEGVIGEVKRPLVADLADWRSAVRPPVETLPGNFAAARAAVDRSCAETPLFTLSGCCPRPWERYQFLRGTENALCDLMDPDANVRDMLRTIHEFHLRECEFWAGTHIDAIFFMDDWGAQRQSLIPPAVWRDLFKPMYRDYIDIAHAAGKFAFMHSDGHILAIVDDVVELGLDALNSQLFCMDMDEYARKTRGKLTLWGEIDRQHVLASTDPAEARAAVRSVAARFYDPRGGLVAQCEAGPGANPAAVDAVFDEWERVGGESAPPFPAPDAMVIEAGGVNPEMARACHDEYRKADPYARRTGGPGDHA